jgi:four helix bundle protein
MFPYENWPVYRKALELRSIAQQLSKTRTRGLDADLRQLRRSSSSCVLNIAEGAGHSQPGKKLESYRTALGSAYESGGTCKILEQHIYERDLAARGRGVSDEIAAQMVGLIRSVENRQ